MYLLYLFGRGSSIPCGLLISLCVGVFLTKKAHGHSTTDDVIARNTRDIYAGTSYFYYQQPEYPRDCQEVYDQCHETTDGVYVIKPDGYPEPFEVFCNNTIDSGGWTVFQRRMDGGVDFYRDWEDYKNGFGFLHRDFWLGNEKISHITNQKKYEMRLDMVDSTGSTSYGYNELFRISDEGTKYSLVGLGSYNGTVGRLEGHDYMASHRNQAFTTRDRDNDHLDSNCAVGVRGAWWYNACYNSGSNLNGNYTSSTNTGVCLHDATNTIHCGFQYVEMKIRPIRKNT